MTTSTAIGPIQILATSFFSTHHGSAADVLAGSERSPATPAFPLLVARARRFTSLVTQMHVEVCGQLPIDPAQPPISVFATCHGEIQTAETLIADFHKNAIVSSAKFALSVHNTPSGLYSVATANNAPSTTITGGNAIAAGFLEAVLTALEAQGTVLLSIADEPVPAVFHGPSEPVGVAAAFLLGRGSGRGRPAQLAIADGVDEHTSSLRRLARVADAASHAAPETIALGAIRPGAMLELRLLAQDARA
jgi:hypothetical protein